MRGKSAMKGFTLTELLQQYPGAIPLTHRALRHVQSVTGCRRPFQHGVAKTEVVKFADGLFRVVQYWVIGQRGSMTHSCLHLSALTPTGGLRRLNQPAKCGEAVP